MSGKRNERRNRAFDILPRCFQAIVAGQPKPFTLHNLSAVRRREDLGPDGIADIISMNDLCEASILWNLKVRYDKQHIYVSWQSYIKLIHDFDKFC